METSRLQIELDAELDRLNTSRSGGKTVMDILCASATDYSKLDPQLAVDLHPVVQQQVEIHARYRGYIHREQSAVTRARREEGTAIPSDFDYSTISALRYESREKLQKVRPSTLAQAARIPGVNPVDVAIVSVHIKRLRS